MRGWLTLKKGLIHLFVYLSTCPFTHPSICPYFPSIHPSICPSYPSIHPSSIHPSFHLIHPFIHLSFIHPSILPFIHLSACPSIPYASITPTLPGGAWNVGALCSPKPEDEEQGVWGPTQANNSWLCFQFFCPPNLFSVPLSYPSVIPAIFGSRASLGFWIWQIIPLWGHDMWDMI